MRRLQTLQPRRRIRARVEAPPTSTETASATAMASYAGNIDVRGSAKAALVSRRASAMIGPPACPGHVRQRPFTVNWLYNSQYTGANFGSAPGDSGPPPGGSTSTQYGDCECYCDGTYPGNIDVDDGQGGVGITESLLR